MAARSDVEHGAGERGLAAYRAAASDAAPRYLESASISPTRSIGLGSETTLKATFWHSTIEETPQAGDPGFVSIALNTGGGRVWRNNETTPTDVGAIALQPFEGAHWRFERPVSFVHFYVPFALVGTVAESLFERSLAHADLHMSSAIRERSFCVAAHAVKHGLSAHEPTNLLLDSWALVLAEPLVRQFSSHAQRPGRGGFGKIPARGVAQVVGHIEAGIDQDLRLASLADVAGMSVYHFARSFRETAGVSPHAYVLSRRIRRSQELLQWGKGSLAEVAIACGFSSQAHFTTAFQRSVGVTPGAYRQILAA